MSNEEIKNAIIKRYCVCCKAYDLISEEGINKYFR